MSLNNGKFLQRSDNVITDCHCHILPRIDDGSQSVQESIALLKMEYQQEVGRVIATPHFYASKYSVERFLTHRRESYENLLCGLEKEDRKHPEIYLGAEVYYFPGVGKAEHISKLCLGESNYLLLEMPFCQWDKEVLHDVTQLLERQKLKVILAHLERYHEFQKKKEIWNEILQLPVILQVNADSFFKWKKKKFCLDVLKKFDHVVLGSDCHNISRRPPHIEEARQIILEKGNRSMLEKLDSNAKKIWQA